MTTEPLNTLEQANKVLEGKLEKMREALKHAISLPVDKMYLFQVNKFYVERILEECK